MIKFSIIIPCFNGEKFLKDALNSLVSQSNQNFEVIFVDDGSTDGSRNIFHQYSTRFDHKYIFQNNSGNGDATYRGIQCSSGSYITFLDCDDMYFPNRLENFENAILEYNFPDVIYSDSIIIDERGKSIGRRSVVLSKPLLFGNVFRYYCKSSLMQSTMVAYKRETIFLLSHIFNKVRIKYANDYALGLYASTKYHFYCLVDPLSYYRIHPESSSFVYSDYMKIKEKVKVQQFLLLKKKLSFGGYFDNTKYLSINYYKLLKKN